MTSRIHSAAAIAAGTATTNGLQTVDVASFDLSAPGVLGNGLDNIPFDVEALLIGMSTTNLAGRARVSRGFKRVATVLSALAVQESIVAGANGAMIGEVGLATALATLTLAGNIVKVQATGIVGLNIVWTGYLWLNSGEF